jgi:hypothetical protein
MKRLTVLLTIALTVACGQGGTGAPDPNAPEPTVAGDIPDNQVFVPYTPADGRFTVTVPEGWARTTDGTAVVFTDKFNSVRIEAVSRPQAPTTTSVTTDELPALRSLPGFRPGAVTSAHRTAGEVVLITYETSSPPDPVTGKRITESVERYDYWQEGIHGGIEAVLTLSGPKGADNVDPWRTVTDSFRWLG